MARGVSWGAWGMAAGALAERSCGQTCWQPVGRDKGRSSKCALSAQGSAGDQAVATRSTRVEAEEAWKEAGAPLGAEGLRGRAHSPADRQEAAGLRACRTSRTAGSPAFPSDPSSVPPPEVQNIYKVCNAPQAWAPGASGRACPTSALGSVQSARAASLGVQGRAQSECARARRPSRRRNPRPSATVLGIDGSISVF